MVLQWVKKNTLPGIFSRQKSCPITEKVGAAWGLERKIIKKGLA
jgi:hypothetical protein